MYKTLTAWDNDNEEFNRIFIGATNLFELTPLELYDYFLALYPTRLVNFDTESTINPVLYLSSRITSLTKIWRYKWDTLYNTTQLEYKPLENYNMVESSTDNTTASRNYTDNSTLNNSVERKGTISDSGTDTMTGTDEQTTTQTGKGGANNNSTITRNETGSRSENVQNNTTTFDSSVKNDTTGTVSSDSTTNNNTETAENASTNTAEMSGKNSTVLKHTAQKENTTTNNLTDTTAETGKKEGTENNTNVLEHTLTRSGNIGVTTSQQMLQSERDIANFSVIFSYLEEIANYILLPIYD